MEVFCCFSFSFFSSSSSGGRQLNADFTAQSPNKTKHKYDLAFRNSVNHNLCYFVTHLCILLGFLLELHFIDA